jgi:hypothetical protein
MGRVVVGERPVVRAVVMRERERERALLCFYNGLAWVWLRVGIYIST